MCSASMSTYLHFEHIRSPGRNLAWTVMWMASSGCAVFTIEYRVSLLLRGHLLPPHWTYGVQKDLWNRVEYEWLPLAVNCTQPYMQCLLSWGCHLPSHWAVEIKKDSWHRLWYDWYLLISIALSNILRLSLLLCDTH